MGERHGWYVCRHLEHTTGCPWQMHQHECRRCQVFASNVSAMRCALMCSLDTTPSLLVLRVHTCISAILSFTTSPSICTSVTCTSHEPSIVPTALFDVLCNAAPQLGAGFKECDVHDSKCGFDGHVGPCTVQPASQPAHPSIAQAGHAGRQSCAWLRLVSIAVCTARSRQEAAAGPRLSCQHDLLIPDILHDLLKSHASDACVRHRLM